MHNRTREHMRVKRGAIREVCKRVNEIHKENARAKQSQLGAREGSPGGN